MSVSRPARRAHRRSRRAYAPRLLASTALVASARGVASAQSEFASDNNWGIGLGFGGDGYGGDGYGGDGYGGDGSSGDSFSFNQWSSGVTTSSPFRLYSDHVFEQSFFFRTSTPGGTSGYESREFNVGELGYAGSGNVTVGGVTRDDQIFFEFGGSDAGLGVRLVYDLDGAVGGRADSSTVSTTATVTNFSGDNLGLAWYAYQDFDIDGQIGNEVSSLFSANTIRQDNAIGSRVTSRTTAGLNPTGFDNRQFAGLISELQDDSITVLGNSSNSGLGDATSAFQWGTVLTGGASETFHLDYEGVFQTIVLPDATTPRPDGSVTFSFTDPNPPRGRDGRPIWYDPFVAVGYDYVITDGDNAFDSLYLPLGFADEGGYQVQFLDEDGNPIGDIFDAGEGGDELAFAFVTGARPQGVAAFRLFNIDVDAGLDPDDTTAFPTGLTFLNGNAVSFDQTSLVVEVVPEPTTLAVLGVGSLTLLRRRR